MTYSLYHIGIDPDLNTGYIGITCNPKARFIQHGYSKTRSNTHLKNALLKYGKDVFKRIVVSNLDKEAAELLEEMLRPKPNMGWNITKGGGIPPNPKGKERSAEYRSNISKAKIGANNPMYGRKVTFSETHRKNLSIAIKGRISKYLGVPRPIVVCPKCNKSGGLGSMQRWHFERCKNGS
jgi:group I intron endonuclease